MTDQGQHYYIAETADGKFVAYTTRAPFFCFTENTEKDAIRTADRALELVARINPDDFHAKSVSRTVTELTPTKVIRRELALAD